MTDTLNPPPFNIPQSSGGGQESDTPVSQGVTLRKVFTSNLLSNGLATQVRLPNGATRCSSLPEGGTLYHDAGGSFYIGSLDGAIIPITVPTGISIELSSEVGLDGEAFLRLTPSNAESRTSHKILIDSSGGIRGVFLDDQNTVISLYAINRERWTEFKVTEIPTLIAYYIEAHGGKRSFIQFPLMSGTLPEGLVPEKDSVGTFVQILSPQENNGLYLRVSDVGDCLANKSQSRDTSGRFNTQYYMKGAGAEEWEMVTPGGAEHRKIFSDFAGWIYFYGEDSTITETDISPFQDSKGRLFIWDGKKPIYLAEFIDTIYHPNLKEHGKKISLGGEEYIWGMKKRVRARESIYLYKKKRVLINNQEIDLWCATEYHMPIECVHDGILTPLTVDEMQFVGGHSPDTIGGVGIMDNADSTVIFSVDINSGIAPNQPRLLNPSYLIAPNGSMSGLDDEFGIPICPIPGGNGYLWIDREEGLGFLHGLYFGNRGWVKQNTEYSTKTDWVYVSADYKSGDVLTFIYEGFSYILQACQSRKSSPEGRKYNIQISRAAVTPGNMILPGVQRNRVHFEELDNTEYANRELMEKIFAFFKQHGLEARGIIDMTTPTETQLLWE